MKFKAGDYVRFVGYNLSERDYDEIKDILIRGKVYKITDLIRGYAGLSNRWYLKHKCDNGDINGMGEQHYELAINITKEQKDKLLNMIREI